MVGRTQILDRMDAMRVELGTLRGEVAYFTDHTYEVDLQRELRAAAEAEHEKTKQKRAKLAELCDVLLDFVTDTGAMPVERVQEYRDVVLNLRGVR